MIFPENYLLVFNDFSRQEKIDNFKTFKNLVFKICMLTI